MSNIGLLFLFLTHTIWRQNSNKLNWQVNASNLCSLHLRKQNNVHNTELPGATCSVKRHIHIYRCFVKYQLHP